MRAVIVEADGRFAAAMGPDGQFVRVRDKGYAAGDEVELEEKKAPRRLRRIVSAVSAAAACLVLMLTGLWSVRAPYALVTMDVNPSIELTLNCFQRVISAEGVNEDGAALLAGMELDEVLGQPVTEALLSVIEALRSSGYLDGEGENYIVLDTSARSAELAESLASALQEEISQQTELTVLSYSSTMEQAGQALASGTTAGKLSLVDELRAALGDEDFDEEQWLSAPVSEIMAALRVESGASGEEEAASQEPPAEEEDLSPSGEASGETSGAASGGGENQASADAQEGGGGETARPETDVERGDKGATGEMTPQT